MPDVVDSDVDKNNGGLFLQDVLVETLLAVGDLVSAYAGSDHFDIEIGVRFGNGRGTQGDIAGLADSGGGDGVAEEDDAVVFLEWLLGQSGSVKDDEEEEMADDGECFHLVGL